MPLSVRSMVSIRAMAATPRPIRPSTPSWLALAANLVKDSITCLAMTSGRMPASTCCSSALRKRRRKVSQVWRQGQVRRVSTSRCQRCDARARRGLVDVMLAMMPASVHCLPDHARPRHVPPLHSKMPLTPPLDADVALDAPVLGQHTPQRLALIQRLRAACVAALVALIALCVAWELWLAPLPGGTCALAWKALPLTLAVAGMLRHRLYTYRWMSLLIWLYFTEGVVRAVSDRGTSQWLAGVEVVLSTALFVGCLVYVRQRLKVLPPKAKKGSAKGMATKDPA